MKTQRIYTDTSVIGGCLDDEFADDSNRVMDLARRGKLLLVFSEVVARELQKAPEDIQQILRSLPEEVLESVEITAEVDDLAQEYLNAGILTDKWMDDALHVAAATVARVDAIVSWNFRHIVRLDKIRAYNEVNQRLGYPPLTIITPLEVRDEENEDENENV